MLTALVVGVVVSFGMAILPGPISIAVIKQALDGRYRDGVIMAMSASGTDVLYALIAAFASNAIFSTVRTAVMEQQWVMLLFQVVCVVVLVLLGMKYYRATVKTAVETQQAEAAQEAKARRLGLKSPAMLGVMIAVTNLASPTFLPTLTGMVTYLHLNDWIKPGAWNNVSFAVGFGVGAFLWFFLLLRFLHARRERIPANFIGRIYKFAGLTFLFFAGIIAYHIAIETSWAEMFG